MTAKMQYKAQCNLAYDARTVLSNKLKNADENCPAWQMAHHFMALCAANLEALNKAIDAGEI